MTPQIARQCFQQMNALLTRQIDEIDGISSFLQAIKKAIATNELDSLKQLLSQQNPLENIGSLETQRHQLLTTFGYELSQQGMEQCIDDCDHEGVLGSLYQSFQQSLSDLQHAIQVNNLLIDKNKIRIRNSLKLLTGQQNADSTNLYSRRGQALAHNNGRSIAQA